MNDKPHLDVEALAELQDVMEDEFDVLIQTYLADSRSRIDGHRPRPGSTENRQCRCAPNSRTALCPGKYNRV